MDAGTEIVAQQVADRMAQMRLENALKSKEQILTEAFCLLRELGEDELADKLLAASKRVGDKLK